MMILEIMMLIGLLAVASNPSPYFAALGLVGGAGAGCLVLVKGGVTFLSLVLFLVYLGGMMVVFAYCAALVAEPYPEAWGSYNVTVYLISYGVLLLGWVVGSGGVGLLNEGVGEEGKTGEWWGGASLFSEGWMLFFGGWGLLLMLFVALDVVGHKGGSLSGCQ
uniref:NADH-ubiquinone oxidoreductase chain 6 n=1 Tax=Indirana semipalmata TaxID=691012 RepID=A0A1D9CIY2_9NEOB|nr:NADH dehydrogenase subunit 6 [Indirana semipalmata]